MLGRYGGEEFALLLPGVTEEEALSRADRLRGAVGKIGFISPLGESFCGGCNRLRLTSDGNLRPCLLCDIELALLPALRAGEPILPILQQAVDAKPVGHQLAQTRQKMNRCMLQIGG